MFIDPGITKEEIINKKIAFIQDVISKKEEKGIPTTWEEQELNELNAMLPVIKVNKKKVSKIK